VSSQESEQDTAGTIDSLNTMLTVDSSRLTGHIDTADRVCTGLTKVTGSQQHTLLSLAGSINSAYYDHKVM